jgi:hypothetical protein
VCQNFWREVNAGVQLVVPEKLTGDNRLVGERLEELGRLRSEGKISDGEFEDLRAKILNDL